MNVQNNANLIPHFRFWWTGAFLERGLNWEWACWCHKEMDHDFCILFLTTSFKISAFMVCLRLKTTLKRVKKVIILLKSTLDQAWTKKIRFPVRFDSIFSRWFSFFTKFISSVWFNVHLVWNLVCVWLFCWCCCCCFALFSFIYLFVFDTFIPFLHHYE